ncbi:MAG: helix-turn-helix domain-containing protein [Gammaproteobacteria bacterium]|nr:helix-turn-helix domain-containing protein [Gammaproteobacteria bacterium]
MSSRPSPTQLRRQNAVPIRWAQPSQQLIADRVGYRNAGDFTRAFRRHFGVTPRQYRRGHLEANANAPTAI